MFRRLVNLLAATALLLQASAGWTQAHLSPHEPSANPRAAAEAAMPCHGNADKATSGKQAAGKSCCQDNCYCAHACSTTALPAPGLELDDFIAAHFEALRSQPSAAPAHSQTPQRPPAPQG